jgi:hypothetical protein
MQQNYYCLNHYLDDFNHNCGKYHAGYYRLRKFGIVSICERLNPFAGVGRISV